MEHATFVVAEGDARSECGEVQWFAKGTMLFGGDSVVASGGRTCVDVCCCECVVVNSSVGDL